MDSKYPLHPGIYPLTHLCLILALTFGGKPSRLNTLLFIPIVLLSIFAVLFTLPGDPPADHMTCMMVVGILFHGFDSVLLRNYQPELREIGQKKSTSEMSLRERLGWATRLSFSTRGIGWAHEATDHIPQHPQGSRLSFVVSQLSWTGFYLLMFDICSIIIRANPCFGTGGPSLTAFGWLWRTTVWVFIVYTYANMALAYNVLSIFCVAVGISKPQAWPHLFDSPWKAYTLRNCWGRVWHQMLRKRLITVMDFASDTLHLPKGQFRTYFKLYGTFFLSGMMHYLGEYVLIRGWSGPTLHFFVLQAVGITIEDVFVAIAARLGYTKPTAVSKLIGFVWVFAWFTYSLPMWIDPAAHAGALDGVSFSLILGIWRGEWTPKRVPLP